MRTWFWWFVWNCRSRWRKIWCFTKWAEQRNSFICNTQIRGLICKKTKSPKLHKFLFDKHCKTSFTSTPPPSGNSYVLAHSFSFPLAVTVTKAPTCSSLLVPEPKGPSSPLSCDGCRLKAPPASLNMAHFSSRLSCLDMERPRGFLGDRWKEAQSIRTRQIREHARQIWEQKQ